MNSNSHYNSLEKEIQDYYENKYLHANKQPLQSISLSDEHKTPFHFSLTPEDIEAFLNQYVTGQEKAKATIATKICTHFRRLVNTPKTHGSKNIKNNMLLIGPTGVGKTYIMRQLASLLKVPFIKADATKFSETGYVGGDVEDLVRNLVAKTDGDIELAEHGIIYLDEIDKIAAPYPGSSLDVSRSGVQRTLLKLLEETEIEISSSKNPSNTERTKAASNGKLKTVINTKNILFIASGAFSGIENIIDKRLSKHAIGFGSKMADTPTENNLTEIRPSDLIEYGFETEFVGRFPVIVTLNKLDTNDLCQILKNQNSHIIASKKMDFMAYGIELDIDDGAIETIAELAHQEGTGARGLIAVIERILMPFEKKLPSTQIKSFILTKDMVKNPEKGLLDILSQNLI